MVPDEHNTGNAGENMEQPAETTQTSFVGEVTTSNNNDDGIDQHNEVEYLRHQLQQAVNRIDEINNRNNYLEIELQNQTQKAEHLGQAINSFCIESYTEWIAEYQVTNMLISTIEDLITFKNSGLLFCPDKGCTEQGNVIFQKLYSVKEQLRLLWHNRFNRQQSEVFEPATNSSGGLLQNQLTSTSIPPRVTIPPIDPSPSPSSSSSTGQDILLGHSHPPHAQHHRHYGQQQIQPPMPLTTLYTPTPTPNINNQFQIRNNSNNNTFPNHHFYQRKNPNMGGKKFVNQSQQQYNAMERGPIQKLSNLVMGKELKVVWEECNNNVEDESARYKVTYTYKNKTYTAYAKNLREGKIKCSMKILEDYGSHS